MEIPYQFNIYKNIQKLLKSFQGEFTKNYLLKIYLISNIKKIIRIF